jgi:hypothetical protein
MPRSIKNSMYGLKIWNLLTLASSVEKDIYSITLLLLYNILVGVRIQILYTYLCDFHNNARR